MENAILIKGGRIVDPSSGRDEIGDIFVQNGRIAGPPADLPPATEILDARGLVVAPGLIDVHVHLREPGKEEAEDIESGSRAAAAGGFTTVVAMPNTTPAIDSPEQVEHIVTRGRNVGLVRVLPTGSITRNRAGEELAPLAKMAAAGAIAFSDDGTTVGSRRLMQRAMETAAALDIPIMDHAEDPSAEHKGVMHEGACSARLGLPGIPSHVESRIVLRDIELAEQTGCSVHIQHVSARESVELIRRARARGISLSAEATPHHLALTDTDVEPTDTSYKMNPPLRGERDRQALRQAVADGIIEVFATDHAPHTAAAKATGFLQAPFGIVGIETAVGVTYTTMVRPGLMDLQSWLKHWTTNPARILNLETPGLNPGMPADIVLLDLETEWTVDAAAFASRSRNTPFDGKKLYGRAVCAIHKGQITQGGSKSIRN